MATPSLKSIVVKAGECIVLPSDAVIDSVILDGAATVTSTCGTLPTPTSYSCGQFFLWVDCDDNPGHSMDEESTYYTSITIGGNTYVINEKVVYGENCGTVTSVATLNIHITDQALFEFTEVSQVNQTKKTAVTLKFRVPASLFSTVELKVDNGGSTQYYKPESIEC